MRVYVYTYAYTLESRYIRDISRIAIGPPCALRRSKFLLATAYPAAALTIEPLGESFGLIVGSLLRISHGPRGRSHAGKPR